MTDTYERVEHTLMLSQTHLELNSAAFQDLVSKEGADFLAKMNSLNAVFEAQQDVSALSGMKCMFHYLKDASPAVRQITIFDVKTNSLTVRFDAVELRKVVQSDATVASGFGSMEAAATPATESV